MAELLYWIALHCTCVPNEVYFQDLFQKFVLFFLQPPPTYEESIRQSVELPYNILSSGPDTSPPQSVYSNTGPDTPHPVSSDTNCTVLPVWKKLDTDGVTQRIRASKTDQDRILHTSHRLIQIPRDSVYVERQLIMEQPKRRCTPFRKGWHIWMLKTPCDSWPCWWI